MFTKAQEEYLLRHLSRNDVVLFLGAGFSVDATNRNGEPIPLAATVARKIHDLIGYDEEYSETPLPVMYEALLNSGITHERIKEFLESTFLSSQIPQQYDAIVRVYWYKIYTTNIDDVLPRVYGRAGGPRLEIIAYPHDPKERDRSLQSIQAIYLHGKVPCEPNEVVFSLRQYAREANEISPLYHNFVLDYATHPTIFIGTELNEQLLWQYIEAREKRARGVSEHRPESFIIAPRIPAPKRAMLRAFNITSIEASVAEFLDWIEHQSGRLPSREEILRVTLPSVFQLIEERRERGVTNQLLTAFGESFHLVPTSLQTRGDRSFYLLGATPRWEDLFQELDAPREITNTLYDHVEAVLKGDAEERVIVLHGSAGCGKSTILRRLGIRLAQSGITTFLTNSEDIPDAKTIANALAVIDRPTVLLFDNGEVALGQLADIITESESLTHPPVLVIAARSNSYYRRSARIEHVANIKEIAVPHLTRAEIVEIIRILEQNNLLGYLRGLTPEERIREFEDRDRAGKQLLVAMREATSGRGFDEIIEDEYAELPSREARILYLCVALATEAGYRISREQFVGCARVSSAEALDILERNLREIVIPTGVRNDLLILRHRVIAEHMIDVGAQRDDLAEAYMRLLRVVAWMAGSRVRGKSFGLYRELINHEVIYERFRSDLGKARAIYDSIAHILSSDAHFWLQYGMLELEFGDLRLAENYIYQAESINPNSKYIKNSIGYLYMKKAVNATTRHEADQYRARGCELLYEEIGDNDSPYPYHILCSQGLAFVSKWIRDREEVLRELEALRMLARKGQNHFQRNGRLREIAQQIEQKYLAMAISG